MHSLQQVPQPQQLQPQPPPYSTYQHPPPLPQHMQPPPVPPDLQFFNNYWQLQKSLPNSTKSPNSNPPTTKVIKREVVTKKISSISTPIFAKLVDFYIDEGTFFLL